MTVLAISLLVLGGGLGYAAFTATATVTGTAYAGSDGVIVSSVTSGGCTGPGGQAQVNQVGGVGTSAATFNAYYFAPGDSCSINVQVQNTGNVNEAITWGSTVSCSSGCTGISPVFTTSNIGVSPSPLGPSGTGSDTITITLPSGVGCPSYCNAAQNEIDTVTWTYTATAGA